MGSFLLLTAAGTAIWNAVLVKEAKFDYTGKWNKLAVRNISYG